MIAFPPGASFCSTDINLTSPSLGSLRSIIPVFLSYVLSFVYVAISWNNHHHSFHLVRRVNGGMLWANINLLFWVSLVPFATGWMGQNHFAPIPTASSTASPC